MPLCQGPTGILQLDERKVQHGKPVARLGITRHNGAHNLARLSTVLLYAVLKAGEGFGLRLLSQHSMLDECSSAVS